MHILLACSAGMSTSLLVMKMEEAAKAKGIESKIWAVPVDAINNNIDKADVLLLGPQVRFLFKKMQILGEEKGVPVGTIDTAHYGLMNGEKVLEQAINLLNNKQLYN